jgi:DNA ligase-1
MGLIKKPMLAGTLENVDDIQFPVAISEKIDGIRAIVVEGKLLSRTLKDIPNEFIRETLESYLPTGADGEIIVGNTFQESTSAVMTMKTKPIPFKFFWFDYVKDSHTKPYLERMEDLKNWFEKNPIPESLKEFMTIIPLYPIVVSDEDTFSKFEKEILSKGGEGVMVRSMNGPYKFGRSTLREGFLVKWKRFKDAEATIIGFEQLIQEGVPVNALGSFLVKDKVEFSIGTGFTMEQRKDFWKARESLEGKLLKYKFFEVGVKNAPRFPVFIGFRSEIDI